MDRNGIRRNAIKYVINNTCTAIAKFGNGWFKLSHITHSFPTTTILALFDPTTVIPPIGSAHNGPTEGGLD